MVDVSETERKMFGRPFMVTFETDSVNIDPYIVDCQGALFENWRASNFKWVIWVINDFKSFLNNLKGYKFERDHI